MPLTVYNEGEVPLVSNQATLYQADIDALIAGMLGTGVLYGCAVSPQGTPDNTVAVAAGAVIERFGRIVVTAGNVTMPTADSSNPMWVLVSISSSGTKTVTAGTAATNPLLPAIPANHVPLAAIWWPASDTTVASNQITDKRVIIPPAFGAQPYHHGYKAWNGDPWNIQATLGLTAGQINLVKVPVPVAMPISTVTIDVGTAGSGLTSNQCYAGLYDLSGNRLEITGSMHTTWQSTGIKDMALATTITPEPDEVVVAVVANGTGMPAFRRFVLNTNPANPGLSAGSYRCCTFNTGSQTSLPSTLTLTSTSAAANSYWIALK